MKVLLLEAFDGFVLHISWHGTLCISANPNVICLRPSHNPGQVTITHQIGRLEVTGKLEQNNYEVFSQVDQEWPLF